MFRFTIIIPTYNRRCQLRDCLQSLTELNYNSDSVAVIIVDDGGNQALNPVIEEFQGQLSISLIKQENTGSWEARNTGVAQTETDYICFLDDDNKPHSDWLQVMDEALRKDPEAMIGGFTVNTLTNNPYAIVSQLIISRVYEIYNENPDSATFFASNNMVMPRDKYLQIDGFDSAHYPAGGGDRDLCARWVDAGYPMKYKSEAIMYHAHTLTFKTFIKQHFRYGRGAFDFHHRRKVLAKNSLVEPSRLHLRFQHWFVKSVKEVEGAHLKMKAAFLLLLWQFVNAAGFFFQMLTSQKETR